METLVTLEHITKTYPLGENKQNFALRDLSLKIDKGETLGVVGESGSGKSTLARIVMGIERPDSGTALYAGEPAAPRRARERLARAKQAQIIFQDSLASLDPRMTVGDSIAEGMEIHQMFDRAGRKRRVEELLALVGLEAEHAGRYPHAFSGGQRQRIGIARALAVGPEFLVCDEPISALDLLVQSHIMNLLKELTKTLGLTCLFIAHDLNMVHYISDRIAVFYAGQVAELGSADAVCLRPRHPYTRLLLDAVLIPNPDQKSIGKIHPQLLESAAVGPACGCAFAFACPQAIEICRQTTPALRETQPGHFCACHLAQP